MIKMNRSMTSVVNLSNSIIGVSILAMPLCFKQCGIILALFIISLSALLNHFSCYLLLKSAIINRRRNYELLAYDVFGSSGKTLVEVCILLFLLGTCVAFFVIVGDIAPSLISHIFELDQGPQLRAMIMTVLAMFVILPLGLLRNVENLTSFSMMSLLVYLFLALRMLFLSFSKFMDQPTVNIWGQINYWNSSFIITYLPIFSMALSCQSQLFEIFNSDLFQTKTGSLKFIMFSIKKAILICSIVYIVIGLSGYFAFYDVNFSGNILQNLPSGFTTKVTLLFFLITILTSFPLCLFPSRTSLHSLLFRKGAHYDLLSTAHSLIHMSDYHFKLLTIVLIVTTMGISIIFPRVELILALVGSTIGATICFIIPALIFIKICDENTVEYLLSYLLLFFGTAILVFCTMSALHNISAARDNEIEEKINEFKQKSTFVPTKNKKFLQESNLNKPSIYQNEMKSRISNINKLKQSIQIDMNKLKKQEEILKRLEKQQQEQSKMLNELKKHDQMFHNETNKSTFSNKFNISLKTNLTMKQLNMKVPKTEISEKSKQKKLNLTIDLVSGNGNVILNKNSFSNNSLVQLDKTDSNRKNKFISNYSYSVMANNSRTIIETNDKRQLTNVSWVNKKIINNDNNNKKLYVNKNKTAITAKQQAVIIAGDTIS